jgi:hypothetical protein
MFVDPTTDISVQISLHISVVGFLLLVDFVK